MEEEQEKTPEKTSETTVEETVGKKPRRKTSKKKARKKVAKKARRKTKKKASKKTSKKVSKKTGKTSSSATAEAQAPALQFDEVIDSPPGQDVADRFNIICFGDSITEGGEFPEDLRWPALLQGMLDEHQAGKFAVHNKGIAGDTTALALDRFASDVLPLLPGVVLVQFGLNDANVYDWAKYPRVSIHEFKKNLREFYRAIFRKRGTCIFIVNHAIGDVRGRQGNRQSFYENFAPYNEAIRYVANKLQAPLIDLYEIIRERQINIDYFVSLDKMHLTLEGNMKYAAMVYESLTGEEYIFKEFD